MRRGMRSRWDQRRSRRVGCRDATVRHHLQRCLVTLHSARHCRSIGNLPLLHAACLRNACSSGAAAGRRHAASAAAGSLPPCRRMLPVRRAPMCNMTVAAVGIAKASEHKKRTSEFEPAESLPRPFAAGSSTTASAPPPPLRAVMLPPRALAWPPSRGESASRGADAISEPPSLDSFPANVRGARPGVATLSGFGPSSSVTLSMSESLSESAPRLRASADVPPPPPAPAAGPRGDASVTPAAGRGALPGRAAGWGPGKRGLRGEKGATLVACRCARSACKNS